MRVNFFSYAIIVAIYTTISSSYAEEVINDVAAMVGDTPITLIDIDIEMGHKKYNTGDNRNKESRVLDSLIEKAIIERVMKDEVISISDKQIDDIINQSMKDNGYKDTKSFEAALFQQMHLTLSEYREEIANNLKIQQISQLKISVPAPKAEEIKQWYTTHKNEVGNKYLLRAIKSSFNPNNPKEELSINQLMNKARNEALANFHLAAGQYSDDPSASNGGLLGWSRIDEIAIKDPILANVVYKLNPGEVSPVFVSNNSYYIVKAEVVTPISMDEATPLIAQRLYREKQKSAYQDWLKTKRKDSAIRIYLKGYQPLTRN